MGQYSSGVWEKYSLEPVFGMHVHVHTFVINF